MIKKILQEAEKLAADNQLVNAAELAGRVLSQGDENERLEALRLRLYVFNRKQWIPEAKEVVDALTKYKSLGRDLLLEVALYNVLLGCSKTARRYFKRALEKSPKDALLFSELAITLEQDGKSDKALYIYNKLIRGSLKKRQASDIDLKVLGRISNLRTLEPLEIALLERAHYNNLANSKSRQTAFILARAHRKKGDIEAEIEWLKIGNRLALEQDAALGSKWDRQFEMRRLELMRSIFPVAKPDWMPNFNPISKPFIFILGMPRSGTTLLEQIVGSHSRVENTGESRGFEVAVAKVQRAMGPAKNAKDFAFLNELPALDAESFEGMARYYAGYQSLFSHAEILSDKLLSNIFHVGLLGNLFPNAYFLFIERDPLDNCASLMQHDFYNAPYANNAVDCVREHELYRMRAEHWAGVFGDRFMMLKYESLARSPEHHLRLLIDFLGLDWEDAVLNFHARKNSVRTPSQGQVRSAISTAQIGKWKRYSELLLPAIELLGRQAELSENDPNDV